MTPPPWDACERSLAIGSKSFTIAARLFPRERRQHVAALYAWCRACDDRIDDVPRAAQPAALAALRAELCAIYAGAPMPDAASACFQAVVQRYAIPARHPADLLEGFAMDAAGTEYETMADLERYAYCVAGTVGLMLCHVMGVHDERAHPHAAALGIAMQLTNICRDIAEDWACGRLDLPAALLGDAAAGLRGARGSAFPTWARPAATDAVRRLLAEADVHYRSADRGLRYLDARSRAAVATARLVYAAIGREIARRRYDVFEGRAVVPRGTKARLTLQAIAGALRPRLA